MTGCERSCYLYYSTYKEDHWQAKVTKEIEEIVKDVFFKGNATLLLEISQVTVYPVEWDLFVY